MADKMRISVLNKIKATTQEFQLMKSLKQKKLEVLENILLEQNFRTPLNSINSNEMVLLEF
jgi:hypothetical protein